MTRMVLILAMLLVAAPVALGQAPKAGGSAATQPTAASPPAPAEAKKPGTPPGEPSIFSWVYWQEGGRGTSRSEIFRNFGLALVALVGVGFGVWRSITAHRQTNVAAKQASIAEQGQFTERFSTAVEHLGSDQLPVRLGGIYALWRLAQDSPARDMTSVIDIFCAFVRNPPHVTPQGTDVQTILDLICEKEAQYRQHLPPGYRRNLNGAGLTGLGLDGADLRDAELMHADLTSANFSDADLTGAQLGYTTLTGALFIDATLARAGLRFAKSKGVMFVRTNLTYADLTGAELAGADLMNADLTNAYLSGTELTETLNLTQAQIDVAYFDPDHPSNLPPGLLPPPPAPPSHPPVEAQKD